jgi:hypothetical protein
MMIFGRDNFVEGTFWRGMILRRGDSGEGGVWEVGVWRRGGGCRGSGCGEGVVGKGRGRDRRNY